MRPDKIKLRVRAVTIGLSERVSNSEVYAFPQSDRGFIVQIRRWHGWSTIRPMTNKYYCTQKDAELAAAKYLQRAVDNYGRNMVVPKGVTSILSLEGVERFN